MSESASSLELLGQRRARAQLFLKRFSGDAKVPWGVPTSLQPFGAFLKQSSFKTTIQVPGGVHLSEGRFSYTKPFVILGIWGKYSVRFLHEYCNS